MGPQVGTRAVSGTAADGPVRQGGDAARQGGDPARRGGGPARQEGGRGRQGGGPVRQGGGPARQGGGPRFLLWLLVLLLSERPCHSQPLPAHHASTLALFRDAARTGPLRAAFRRSARADLMRVRERLIRQAREGRKGEGRERVEGSAGGARRAFPARVLQAANGSVILEAPQCAALRDVKAAMKPSNWPDGPQSCACASWPGVACSPAGSVLSLALQGAAGTLPTSLARLSQLSSLSFQEVNLTQSLEWDIPAMPSMARVSLLSAGRPSPLQDLGWLSAFSALRSLAANTGFYGVLPDELSMLCQLSSLDLSSSGLEILPHWLPQLSQLRVLDLAEASVYQTIPASLGMLQELELLDMNNNLLWGTIPLDIFNLSKLIYLDLSSNALVGSIPLGISNLGVLTTFDLHNNSLTGPIPSQCFQLPALRHLHLDMNDLHGPLPANMGRATGIQELSLAENPLGGAFPDAVVQLRSLSVLRLGGCQLNGTMPQEVSGLSKLHVLGLANNNLSGVLAPLAYAPDLHYLGLQNNSFHGAVPEAFSRLQLLQYAVLSRNRLAGTFPDQLLKIPSLKLLDLAYNRFSGALPSFERWAGATMDLSYNVFSGPIPSLNQVPNISFVNLAANNLSGTLDVQQLAGLTALVALELSHNELTGSLPDISGIPGLRYLDVSNNKLSDWELTSPVSVLETLDLSGNQLSMSLPASISLLRSLSNLVLSRNQLWGDFPDPTRMPPLVSLVLDYNAFAGTFPSAICGLSTLEALSLRGNAFYGPLPNCLYALSHVNFMDLGKNAFFGPLQSAFQSPPRVLAVDSNYLTWEVPLYAGGEPFCPSGVPPRPVLTPPSWNSQQQPAMDGAHPGEDVTADDVALGTGLDVDDLYLYGPLYSVASSLANNCFQLQKNECAAGVAYEWQRPPEECQAVCSLTPLGVVCGGKGFCVPVGGSITSFTCECFPDHVLAYSAAGDPTCEESLQGASPLSSGAIAGIAVGSALALGLLLGALVFVVLRPSRRRRRWADLDVCHEFSLREVEAATENWNAQNLLGEGGYGMVYRGKSPKGELWAVKRAKLMTNDFEKEVRAMASLHHPHLVRLLGFCLNYDVATGRQEQILVYEFVQNGDLEKMLFDKRQAFSLAQRIEVAIGTAEGLEYLHSFASPIIHRDVKPSNILLDHDLHAKIADFGLLKKLSGTDHTRVAGTPGFVDPEYNRTKIPTPGCDVYSFGVVLLELIVGQPATTEEGHIVETVREHFEASEAQPILDPRLRAPDVAVLELTLVAMDAVRCPAIARPTMAALAMRLRALQAKYEGQLDACETSGSEGCVSSSQSGTCQPGSVSGTVLEDSPV